jgi:hypothetical protein
VSSHGMAQRQYRARQRADAENVFDEFKSPTADFRIKYRFPANEFGRHDHHGPKLSGRAVLSIVLAWINAQTAWVKMRGFGAVVRQRLDCEPFLLALIS